MDKLYLLERNALIENSDTPKFLTTERVERSKSGDCRCRRCAMAQGRYFGVTVFEI